MGVDRSQLPALGPDPAFVFPEIRRQMLGNGLRVWTIEHHAVPLVSFLLLLPAGAAADPPDRPGLAAITSDLLDEGCGDLDALEVHDALGRMGGHLDTEIGSDATLLTLTSLARFADRAIDLLADMVIRPRLEQRDFDRVRDLRINRLVQFRDLPPALAERAFAELLYQGHPYGHLPIGTEGALRSLTLREVTTFHREVYDPSQVTVIAAGAAPHGELAALVERALGSWTVTAAARRTDPSAIDPPAAPATRLTLVHRAGAPQSELRIGHVAVPRSTRDYHALLVMNMVLGGQFVSRINTNLRERKGYTYGARTAFDFRRGRGPFVLSTSVQSDATVDAIREGIAEIRAIRGERPVTRKELEIGRAGLTRGYPRNFETAEQISRAAAQLALYDLPDDYFSTFVPKVLAVDEAEVTRVAAQHIDPSRLLAVIVGDRDKVAPGLPGLDLGAVSEVSPS